MDFTNDKNGSDNQAKSPSSASYHAINNGSAGWGGDPLVNSIHQMARNTGTMNNTRYSTYRNISVNHAQSVGNFPLGRANESVYRSIQMMNHPTFATRELALQKNQIRFNRNAGPQVTIDTGKPTVVVSNNDEVKPEFPMVALGPCHFYVRSGVKNIVAYMAKSLEKLNIDVVFRNSKCKWKATAYQQPYEMTFRVYLFAHDIEGVYALELQRRTGCASFFAKTMKDIQNEFADAGMVCSETGQGIQKPTLLQPPQLNRSSLMQPPPLAPGLSKQTGNISSLKPLFEMSKSDYSELQTQAFSEILSQCCNKPHVCDALSKERDVVLHCIQSLKNGNQCVVRCAASILALLVSAASCQQVIIETGSIGQLAQLVSTSTCQPEIKRQSLSILSKLCRSGHKQVVLDHVGTQFFNQLKNTPDTRLRSCALETQQLLGVC